MYSAPIVPGLILNDSFKNFSSLTDA